MSHEQDRCRGEGAERQDGAESRLADDPGGGLLVIERLLISENEGLRKALETALCWCPVCHGEGVIEGTWREASWLPCPTCASVRARLRDRGEEGDE